MLKHPFFTGKSSEDVTKIPKYNTKSKGQSEADTKANNFIEIIDGMEAETKHKPISRSKFD